MDIGTMKEEKHLEDPQNLFSTSTEPICNDIK